MLASGVVEYLQVAARGRVQVQVCVGLLKFHTGYMGQGGALGFLCVLQ